MVSIKFNFGNKTFYTILVIAMLLIISGFVYAYTSIPDPGHGADSVQVTVAGEEMTLQQAIDQNKLGGSATTYSCHWEKSWVTYTAIGTEGAEITGGDNANEKTSCNFGQCQLKADSVSCDLSLSTCTTSSNIDGCGKKTNDKNEYLYCCG